MVEDDFDYEGQLSQWAKDEAKENGQDPYAFEGWIRSHRPGGLAAHPLKIPFPHKKKLKNLPNPTLNDFIICRAANNH